MIGIQPPYKILVVDDEPDLQPLVEQRMRRYVRRGQYQFVFAQNGVEALERLREDDEIVIVLSDINMPKMDGLALLEQIPKVNPNIRSVIISAYGDMKNIRTAMNRGAFDFVTKPVDFDDLKLTIDRTLQQLLEWRDALGARDRLVALQNELDVASQMQQSILPKRFPRGSGYEVFASMKPARSVGGDFFDVMRLEGGLLGLAVADVSDKGVPAALFMMSSRTLLKGAAIGLSTPSEVLAEVNNLLCEDNETAMFVTLLYAVYDPVSRMLTFANGGHNPPVLIDADGNASRLPLTGGVALGLVPDLEYEQSSITLSPGDNVILYTDGVTEAMNDVEEEYGMERLESLFVESLPPSARAVNDAIFDSVIEFAGDAPQSDDITCMTLRAAGQEQQKDKAANTALSLELGGNPAELERMAAAVEEFAEQQGWPDGIDFKVNLALEELVLNVITHGRPEGPVEVEVTVTSSHDLITVRISDNGEAFNPLPDAPEPEVESSVADREVGGLGIHLVRTMMDDMRYRRELGRNLLTMTIRKS